MASLTIGEVAIEVVAGDLLDQDVAAIMLSANNNLRAGSGWSLEAEKRGGKAYLAECQDVAAAAGRDGLRHGTAALVGGGAMRQGDVRRWILQAITIHYTGSIRTPATPALVYRAVRAALEKAEIYRIDAVATYLMAQKPAYRTASAEVMADWLCRALIDHAGIARSVKRLLICESDPAMLARAHAALDAAARARS